MAPQPPQTLSVKRKRNDAPVHQLVVDAKYAVKRQKSETFVKREARFTWRLLQKPGENVPAAAPSPTQQNRRFHVSLSAGQRVLVEAPDTVDGAGETQNASSVPEIKEPKVATGTAPATPRPRKRPGAGAALRINPAYVGKPVGLSDPSEEQLKHFEEFSQDLEQEELTKSKPQSSPVKYLPTGPARRQGRSSQQAAALDVRHPDAMDIDEYVFDTYVREEVMSDAEGNVPENVGTIGYIVLEEEDEEWWNGEDESDKEFDTDEEDENAEDYYANDYPEDEMSSDDEFNRDPYQQKYRHGSDDEEYDLTNDEGAYSGDEDDEHFGRMTAPGQAVLLNRLGR